MDHIDFAIEPLRALLQETGSYLPRLAVALVVVAIGWLIAKALRLGVARALRAFNFHVLTQRSGVDGFLQQGGTEKDLTAIIGWLVYLAVLLGALIVAFNGLGLTQVTDLLQRVLLFLPRLLVALLVLVFGSYFARFAHDAIVGYMRSAGISDAELLGRLGQYGVMAFVVLLAVDHLDIGGGLIQQTFLILLLGVVLALALAFGLGGRDRAAALLERWFPRRERER